MYHSQELIERARDELTAKNVPASVLHEQKFLGRYILCVCQKHSTRVMFGISSPCIRRSCQTRKGAVYTLLRALSCLRSQRTNS